MSKNVEQLDRVVIRIAGDSGDGMQLTGDRFTQETANFGNDLFTFPAFPAEIRAPQGTLAGVSSFQLHFADHDILTPGDRPDVLVAMNPAALKANVGDLPEGGTVIVDTHDFSTRALARIGWASDPITDGTLDKFTVHAIDLTQLTLDALADTELSRKDAGRAKNMFALGVLSWMYSRPSDATLEFLRKKFANKPAIAEANIIAFKAGWNYGETTETFAVSYEVKPAILPAGTYRNIIGNTALAYGLVAAAQRARLPLFLGAYPITPASDILHELSKHKRFGVRTFQAEDEIAGIGSAIGAAFGGALAVTTSSGPGIVLKGESIGLAVSLEIPLVICDIQRGGPSTGLPTKTEQSDLLLAMFGRNGEAPVPIVAAQSPGDCFNAAIEAARIALTYRTPVFLLSDGYLANGSEPWRVPTLEELPDLSGAAAFATAPNGENGEFLPYLRDPETLARPWAVPGTAGLEHRIGGIEKADKTGNISYEPDNHDFMVRTRQAKVDGIARTIAPLTVDDPDSDARVLVLGWGSTYGPIGAACRRVRTAGQSVAQAHLRHLNPFPANLGEVLARYDKVVIPEMNLGQLAMLIRAKYLIDTVSVTQVRGMPFKAAELAEMLQGVISMSEPTNGSTGANSSNLGLKAKDFKTDQEVRWCPGCGDYAILAAVQGFMPELGVPRENIVFISGIGCSSRFPYYMNTYGMHSIHGRAPAIATGLSTSRTDLSVWVVTGDGDALSIGGNHLIHTLRRNINVKILLFNNRIYGLTKGQYSPTSEIGKITKSTPFGSLDNPFNPVSVALGAEATFVARTLDSDRKHLTSVLRAAADHQGTALVEIYQNCNIFNDGAFDLLKEPETRDDWTIRMEHGRPLRFGAPGSDGVGNHAVIRTAGGTLEIAENVADDDPRVVVHDAHTEDPAYAFALSRLSSIDSRYSPMGVFRSVERPTYDASMAAQLERAAGAAPGDGDALNSLLQGADSWTVL